MTISSGDVPRDISKTSGELEILGIRLLRLFNFNS